VCRQKVLPHELAGWSGRRCYLHLTLGKATRIVLIVSATIIVGAVIGATGSGSAATQVAPSSTSSTTISGSAQLGSTLTATRGSFSGSTPLKYAYQWRRCSATGTACANIDKATKATYTLAQVDVGNTLRAVATATNKEGSATSTSAQTGVVTAPAAPPKTGCPGGNGGITIAALTLPAQLNIDNQAITPAVVLRTSKQITVRLHVSACGNRSVLGAMVYATAVPFNQYSIPAEAATGADGWATLTMSQQAGYPASRQQHLLTMFVRASKTGDPALGGVSARRLISFPVKLGG
jgi:hypothetical protein